MPALLALLSYVWWRCFPVRVGFALSAASLALVVLLVRARQSTPQERRMWSALIAVFFVAEFACAQNLHNASGSYLVARVEGAQVAVMASGPATLRSATMHVVDQFELEDLRASETQDGSKYDRLYDHVPMGDFSKGTQKSFCIRTPKLHGTVGRLRISFGDDNTEWGEDLQTAVVGGKRTEAMRVVRVYGARPVVLAAYADAGYPRDEAGAIDWSWVPPVL